MDVMEGEWVFQRIRKGGRVTGLPLTPQSVALIVKHYATELGLDPKQFRIDILTAFL